MYVKFFKVVCDFVASLFATAFLLIPLILLLLINCLVVRGNPLFSQARVGLNNQTFRLYKLKTMSDQMDADGNLLPDENRLSRFGKFLRSTSLDELPGLLNVLKGEMSLVGPRPLLPEYLPLYSAQQAKRHNVKPGITGWAQVNGRNALSWETKFELDVWYVNNISLMLDINILLLTVKKVLIREGISAAGAQTMHKFEGSKNSDEK